MFARQSRIQCSCSAGIPLCSLTIECWPSQFLLACNCKYVTGSCQLGAENVLLVYVSEGFMCQICLTTPKSLTVVFNRLTVFCIAFVDGPVFVTRLYTRFKIYNSRGLLVPAIKPKAKYGLHVAGRFLFYFVEEDYRSRCSVCFRGLLSYRCILSEPWTKR